MRTSFDVIVVGAGSMGLSAGFHLARQGAKVLLIDAFDPPHTEGSHHGEPRLIRHAYSGSPTYTRLALRADRLWQDLEQETGSSLLVRSGVLNMFTVRDEALETKLARSVEYRLPFELLNADEIKQRWEGITIPESYVGLYEPGAGYLRSEECIRAMRQQAVARGAELLTYNPVTKIDIGDQEVKVYTKSGVYSAGKLILSAGAWVSAFDSMIALPIRAVRKAVAWFQSDEALFDSQRFPGFTLNGADGEYYGFPSIDGAGVKIGRHDAGQDWLPGQPFEPFGHYPEDERHLRSALATYMPRAAGQLLRSAVCKYEMTPDEDFIIDRHPYHSHVYIAGGFSGHGFKFAAVVGEVLSELVVKERTEHDIAPFSLSRFS